uniref:Uncharacterized protein n=1 Tax=Solanum tuberosum TaxID=4113 RepID=M1DLI5_SOLTU
MLRRAIRRSKFGSPISSAIRPFGQGHRLFSLAFKILKAWHIETLGDVMAIRQLAKGTRRSPSLHFFALSTCLLTQDQKGLFKACNGAECKVPGVTSTISDPLGAAIDVSVSDVWITYCTIVSSRSGRSPYMLFYLTSIFSSSVSASDTLAAVLSLCASPVVVRGISEVSGASTLSAASNREVKSVDFK